MDKSFKELWKGKDFTDFGNYKPKPHVEKKKKKALKTKTNLCFKTTMGEREWNFGNSLSPKGIFDPFLVISNTSAPLQQSGLTWSSVQDPAPHSYLSCSCEL